MLQPLASPTTAPQPNSAFIQPRADQAQGSTGGVQTFSPEALAQNEETDETNRDDEQRQEQRADGERETAPFARADAQAQGRGTNVDILV